MLLARLHQRPAAKQGPRGEHQHGGIARNVGASDDRALAAAWDAVDVNKNGALGSEALRLVLERLGVGLSSRSFGKALRCIDAEGPAEAGAALARDAFAFAAFRGWWHRAPSRVRDPVDACCGLLCTPCEPHRYRSRWGSQGVLRRARRRPRRAAGAGRRRECCRRRGAGPHLRDLPGGGHAVQVGAAGVPGAGDTPARGCGGVPLCHRRRSANALPTPPERSANAPRRFPLWPSIA